MSLKGQNLRGVPPTDICYKPDVNWYIATYVEECVHELLLVQSLHKPRKQDLLC